MSKFKNKLYPGQRRRTSKKDLIYLGPASRGVSLREAKKKIGRFVSKNRTDNFDKAIDLEIAKGNYPEWVQALIEFDANPVEAMSERQFCKIYEIHDFDLWKMRKKYPNYWMAVQYRRKKFMAQLGHYAMKVLAGRMHNSDKALQMALEMTGLYTPTIKNQIEEINPEQKRMRIEKMLKMLADERDVIDNAVEVLPITDTVNDGTEEQKT